MRSGFFTVYLPDAAWSYPLRLSQSLPVCNYYLVSFERPGSSFYYRLLLYTHAFPVNGIKRPEAFFVKLEDTDVI